MSFHTVIDRFYHFNFDNIENFAKPQCLNINETVIKAIAR